MKRDEAVQLIMDTFEFEGLGTQMRYKDADAILYALDKKGFLPPDIHHCFSHDCQHGPTYRWEKE